MSVTSSLDIVFHSSGTNLSEVYESLLRGGWSISDFGKISYMKTIADFEWEETALENAGDVQSVLRASLSKMQTTGLVLTWTQPLTGGQFLICPEDQSLSISWTINRRILEFNSRITDHSWYLQRVIAPLEKSGFQIEHITCNDC